MNRQRGRPEKYNSKQLIMIIDKFKEEFPLIKITYAKLSLYSNIPYYIWRDNKVTNQHINSSPKIVSTESLDEIILKHMNSKDKLIEIIEHYYSDDLNRIKACINIQRIEKENQKLKQMQKKFREQIDAEVRRIDAYEKRISKYCYK